MKKIGLSLLSLVLVTGLQAQTPEEVVARCVEALGGAEDIAMHTDIRAEGEARFSMYGNEFTGNMNILQKGVKQKIEIEVAFGKDTFTMKSVYNGETAFMDQLGNIVDIPALDFESELDHGFNLLTNPETTFTPGREKEVEGRKAFGVDAKLEGKTTSFFIDAETHTVAEIVYEDLFFGQGQTQELTERRWRFGEYRDFEGVLFPARVTMYEKGEKRFVIDYSQVTFGPEVDHEEFERPDQPPDLRYWEEQMD